MVKVIMDANGHWQATSRDLTTLTCSQICKEAEFVTGMTSSESKILIRG